MTTAEFPPALAKLEQLRQQIERSPAPEAEAETALVAGVVELRQRHPKLIGRWCDHHVDSLRRQIAWMEAEIARITAAAHELDAPRQRSHAAVAGAMMKIEIDECRTFVGLWEQVRRGERDFVLHHYSR